MIHISELWCPFKIVARRPALGRSRKTFLDCRKILKKIRNTYVGGCNKDSFASELGQWLNCEHRIDIFLPVKFV